MNVIITGATGMVGEGVLHECLNHSKVDSVLIINRRSYGMSHPKLKEILHKDFSDFSSIEKELNGYDAAFLCMGVSSVGLKEDKFRYLTYDLTMALAKSLVNINTNMTITYVSGAGTDSTEKGRTMWARIKGKTENDLMKMPFKAVYAFRPGGITPIKGLKNTYPMLKAMSPILPLFRFLMPKLICSLQEVGVAMINAALHGYEKKILEVKDIVELATLDKKQ
ncbi:NAD-dependent epimerase/dehydratase family protein [Flammeovirga sp. SJP92]|uniref:NAD-dependent epimerase/dehydratase family protein n=1 Tax=Flammeovirga sp. SJP92 TaxID=1775430 RepID=UPI0007886E4D|nr:NAD-dependent epimerase/dehydratase family protein [Flammeovirga sp. SJP92]KXX70876.1 epimerase [Flammeovirga sp. SJP92]